MEKPSKILTTAHPMSPCLKWSIVLLQFWTSLLVCTLQGYPQGLQSLLISSPYSFSNFEYGIFYGITTFPNIIIPIFLGFYIDKHGIGISFVAILQIFVLVGTVIVTVGSYYISYPVMVVGRFLQGVGTENIQVVINHMIIKVGSKEEGFKMWGVNLASKRVAIWLCGTVGPLVYTWTNDVPSCFLASIIIGLIGCITFSFSYYFCINVGILEKPKQLSHDEIEKKSLLGEENVFSQIKLFSKEANLVYWLLILITTVNFTMRFGLMSEMNNLIENASHVTALEAGYFLGYYCFLSASFQILWGFVFSGLGYYIYVQITGCIIQLIATGLFVEIFEMDSTYSSFLPLSFWALGYSLGICVVFTAISLVIGKEHYGVASGIYQSAIDFGGTAGPSLFGYIRDMTISDMAGFFWPLMETAGLQAVNLLVGIMILVLDIFGMRVLSQKKEKNCPG